METMKKALNWFCVIGAVSVIMSAFSGSAGAEARSTEARLTQAPGLSPAIPSWAVPADTGLFGLAARLRKPVHSRRMRIAQQSETMPSARRERHDRRGGGSSVGVNIGVGILLDLARERRRSNDAGRGSAEKTGKTKGKKKNTVRRPRRRTKRVAALPTFRRREIVILIDQSAPETLKDELAQTLGLRRLDGFQSQLLGGWVQTYRVLGNQTTAAVLAALSSNPLVAGATRNNYHRVSGKKSKRSKYSEQYALTKMGIPSAHELATGREVLIAVIDAGVDEGHPVLKNVIEAKFNAVGDKTYKAHSHGTAIAGIIGGHGKILGVAPDAKLLAVRAFYTSKRRPIPETTTYILVRALDWAFANGAKIFNLSFTGPRDSLVEKALNYAFLQGTILVAAAGNDGAKAAPAYPAAYEAVIAITATNKADRLYRKANRGDYLTVSAPGVDVLVAAPRKRYNYSSGTSFAAAHVSGLIALLLEHNPEISATDIRDLLMSTAKDLGAKGHDRKFGAGRVDAYASLLKLVDINSGGSASAVPLPTAAKRGEGLVHETAETAR